MLRAGVDVFGLCWVNAPLLPDAGRGLGSVLETGSADVQPASKNWSILTRAYGPPYSTLPRVPTVPHAVSGGLQSLSQRFVLGLLYRARSLQALLFLR
jgi:hypothetical protein